MHDIRGWGRTSIGDIDVRPKRLGTYIRRAFHGSGNPDGAIRWWGSGHSSPNWRSHCKATARYNSSTSKPYPPNRATSSSWHPKRRHPSAKWAQISRRSASSWMNNLPATPPSSTSKMTNRRAWATDSLLCRQTECIHRLSLQIGKRDKRFHSQRPRLLFII